jgi:hypothetical protein
MINQPGWVPLKYRIRIETRLFRSLPVTDPCRPLVAASLTSFRNRLATDPSEQAVDLRRHCSCCGRARDDEHTAECPHG